MKRKAIRNATLGIGCLMLSLTISSVLNHNLTSSSKQNNIHIAMDSPSLHPMEKFHLDMDSPSL